MSSSRNMPGVERSNHDSAEQIEQLLRRVDPRPRPVDREGRVHQVVHNEWLKSVRVRRQRQRWTTGIGVAALLGLAMLLAPGLRDWIGSRMGPPASGPVGEVALIDGLVWLAPAGTPEAFPGRRLLLDDQLEIGSRIETTDQSQVALRITDGSSLRLARDTRIRFLEPGVVALESGTVYVDSADRTNEFGSIEIRTPMGTVQEIGTQFEVRLDANALRIRVREGTIQLDEGEEPHAASAGIELSVDSHGQISRRTVPTVGPMWDWVLEIAPPFALEGNSLDEFLEWVGRETGMEIHFADHALAFSSSEIVLHGSVDGLRPGQALTAVLPTCGLTSRAEGDRLILSVARQ